MNSLTMPLGDLEVNSEISNNLLAEILVVDDEPANLQWLFNILSENGYKVRVAIDGKSALLSASIDPPDLILLDIIMPDMDGYEVCQKLKANPTTKNTAVIFSSTLTVGAEKAKAFQVGAVDYITKPFQVEEVLARVENQINQLFLQKKLFSQTQLLHQQNRYLRAEIMSRKLLEEKLLCSEQKRCAIMTAMTDIVIIIKTQLGQIYNLEIIPTNTVCVDSDNRDLAIETVEHFLSDQTNGTWLTEIQKALDTQQNVHFDFSFISGENEVWLSAAISPLDKDSVILVARDISKRKQAEKALRQSEAREREKALQLELVLQELQQAQAQLVLNEKMAGLGQLVAGVAHEINNPTNFIYGNIKPAGEYAQTLLDLIGLYQQHYPSPVSDISEQLKNTDIDFIAEDFPKLLASISDGATRIREIVKSLRNFSRLDEAKCKQVNVHEGIDNTLLLMQHRLKKPGNYPEIRVIKHYDQLPLIECYHAQLNQVFMNILSNAIDAVEEGFAGDRLTVANREPEQLSDESPWIRISTCATQFGVEIRIANNGDRIEPKIMSRIFDPFFTTKAPGKGTGLGLSISYKIIVEKHGGQLMCNSLADRGTEFIILLPFAVENSGVFL